MMDLHQIANAPGYGTGKAARDRLAAEAECLSILPNAGQIPPVAAAPDRLAAPNSDLIPLALFGNSGDDGQDWSVYHDGGAAETGGMGIDARTDAIHVAAILNAYRMGLLVRAKP